MIVLHSNPTRQAADMVGTPVVQKCFTRGRRPYRALPVGGSRWRYFDTVQQCLQYLQVAMDNPRLGEADVCKVGFEAAVADSGAGKPAAAVRPFVRAWTAQEVLDRMLAGADEDEAAPLSPRRSDAPRG